MSSLDRRSVLTALLGACVAASAVGTAATNALALPLTPPPKPESPAAADPAPGAAETVEGNVHNSQFIVIRRRPRRRWRVWRRSRRRRRYW